MNTREILAINSRRGFASRSTYNLYVKREIRRAGQAPIRAQYDPAGNCTICGEAGECPGWHVAEDSKGTK